MRNILGLLLLSMCIFVSEASAKIYDYTQGNKLTLIENPDESVDHKIELINKARHHIHIMTFFWDNSKVPTRISDALNRAHDRGVEIRILTTQFSTVTRYF